MLSDKSRRRIRVAHTVLFFLIVADGFAAFGYFMVIRQGALESSSATMTAPIRDHGNTWFVTESQASVYHALLGTMVVGIPFVILSGAFLDLVLKIPIAPRKRIPPEP